MSKMPKSLKVNQIMTEKKMFLQKCQKQITHKNAILLGW